MWNQGHVHLLQYWKMTKISRTLLLWQAQRCLKTHLLVLSVHYILLWFDALSSICFFWQDTMSSLPQSQTWLCIAHVRVTRHRTRKQRWETLPMLITHPCSFIKFLVWRPARVLKGNRETCKEWGGKKGIVTKLIVLDFHKPHCLPQQMHRQNMHQEKQQIWHHISSPPQECMYVS